MTAHGASEEGRANLMAAAGALSMTEAPTRSADSPTRRDSDTSVSHDPAIGSFETLGRAFGKYTPRR